MVLQKYLYLIFLAPLFFDLFAIELTNDINLLVRWNTLDKISLVGGTNINTRNCMILASCILKKNLLADEPFAKASWI